MHEFDVSTLQWTEHAAAGGIVVVPPARYGLALTATNDKLFLWGGAHNTDSVNGVTFEDFHSYDPMSRQWKALAVSGSSPGRREGAGFASIAGMIFLFGGHGGPGSSYFNDLWAMTVARNVMWPAEAKPGLFIEIYDWDTVLVDSTYENVLTLPMVLCTMFYPCSLSVEGTSQGILHRLGDGSIACIASLGCTAIMLLSVHIECSSTWSTHAVVEIDSTKFVATRVSFSGCSSHTDGSSIKGYGGEASVKIDSSRFINSATSLHGGGIAAFGGQWLVSNSTFHACSAILGGGAIVVSKFISRYGSIEKVQAVVSLTSCTFDSCRSHSHGGSILVFSEYTETNISHSVFKNSASGESGGAVALRDSAKLLLQNSHFHYNVANMSGGAIFVEHSLLVLKNLSCTNNKAMAGGGGVVFCDGNMQPVVLSLPDENVMCGAGNSAVYGNCFASSYQRLEIHGLPASNSPAFPGITFSVIVEKIDSYNQTIATDYSSLVQAQILPDTNSQSKPMDVLSGVFGRFQAGIALLDLQIKPSFSEVSPILGTTSLTNKPRIYFKSVDTETLSTMISDNFDILISNGSSVCPIGWILSLDSAKLTQKDRRGVCVLCGAGTYSVSPLAGTTFEEPSCLSCPQAATCSGGSNAVFSLGAWAIGLGIYRLVDCPAGYKLLNTGNKGQFLHDVQNCQKCHSDQYIISSNNSRYNCQRCPTGAFCDGSLLTGKTFGSVWIADMTTGMYSLEGCPVGFVLNKISQDIQSCEQWSATKFLSLGVILPIQMKDFTALNQISFLRALANTALVNRDKLMIATITSIPSANRRSEGLELISRIGVENSSEGSIVSSRLEHSSLNSQLSLQGLPQARFEALVFVDMTLQQSGISISVIIGVSIGSFVFLSLLGLATQYVTKWFFEISVHNALVKAIQNSKPGDSASRQHLPYTLQSQYNAQMILGVGAFGCIVQATRKVKTNAFNASLSSLTDSTLSTIAFKIILPARGIFSERELSQLRREASVLELFTASRSECAVHLIGGVPVHVEPKVSWFTMECLTGCNMDTAIQDDHYGPIGDSDCIALARNVLAALVIMHAEGLIHRDIKPSNIMCGKDLKSGERLKGSHYDFKLIDFGTVLGVDEKLAKEEMMTVMSSRQLGAGTPPYMSPEMFTRPETVTYSTDIWSLGVTLFEVVTGRLPFIADSDWLWSICIAGDMDEKAPDILDVLNGERRSHFDKNLSKVIAQSLEKRDENRFQSAEEMCNAIYDCLVSRGETFYSVFISYRVASEQPLARLLFDDLNLSVTPAGHRVTVYWDEFCLAKGRDWKEGFANGLLTSLCLFPILSYGSTAPMAGIFRDNEPKMTLTNWEQKPVGRHRLEGKASDPVDNVLMELMLGGALLSRKEATDRGDEEKGILQFIYPILVGSQYPVGHTEYPGMGSFFDVQQGGGEYPDTPSPPTNWEVANFLRDKAKLPLPAVEKVQAQSVLSAVKSVTDVQGCRLWVYPPDLAEAELSKAQKSLVGTGFTGPGMDSIDTLLTGKQLGSRCAGFDEQQLRMLKAQIREKRGDFHEIIDQAVNAATQSGKLSSGSFRPAGPGESKTKCVEVEVERNERNGERNVDLAMDADTHEAKRIEVMSHISYETAVIGHPAVWQ